MQSSMSRLYNGLGLKYIEIKQFHKQCQQYITFVIIWGPILTKYC